MLQGVCDICGRAGYLSTCSLCGKRACPKCYDPGRGVCRSCIRTR